MEAPVRASSKYSHDRVGFTGFVVDAVMKARARRSDPATSHLAAKTIELEGKAGGQRRACLEAVREHPGKTAYEIAAILGFEGIVPGKRLPELRDTAPPLVRNGEVRVCSVRGSKAMTWWLTERAGLKQRDLF